MDITAVTAELAEFYDHLFKDDTEDEEFAGFDSESGEEVILSD